MAWDQQMCAHSRALALPPPGAAERNATGTQKCAYCPVGAVAKTEAGDVGQTGSIYCDPWCGPGVVCAPQLLLR